MFFANLGLLEFLALFAIGGVVLTLLYLLDRTRRRQVVATLQFWTEAERPTEARRKRRIREPLSLLLQLLALALLLAAVAELRLGSPDETSRDHVLILDTSAWMAATLDEGSLMDEARRQAIRYVRALPGSDRVMVVRAGALVTPVTGFETDRRKVEEAIRLSDAGSAALDLAGAIEFASNVQALDARRPGEIVFAGAGRVRASDEALQMAAPPGLRVLRVEGPVRNAGLRQVGLRHSAEETDLWEVFVSVRNDGESPAPVEVAIQYSGAPIAGRTLTLDPLEEREVSFPLRVAAAGLLEVRLFSEDDFPGDNRAMIEVPARGPMAVTAYSRRSELLRPLVGSSPFVQAVFKRPEEWGQERDVGVVVLDGFHPSNPPTDNVIWVEPPLDDSPAPVKTLAGDVEVSRWHTEHPLAQGLNTEDLRLSRAIVFDASENWEAVAEVEDGAVVLASKGEGDKAAVLGFHPASGGLRFELASPLLFANLLRWFEPELFVQWELRAASAGAIEMPLAPGVTEDQVEVTSADGTPLPATLTDGTLRLFAGSPGVVQVRAGDRLMVYSVALPEVPSEIWEPPDDVARGVPPAMPSTASSYGLWRWLVLAGALLLVAEWLIYGRRKALPGAGNQRARAEQPMRRAS